MPTINHRVKSFSLFDTMELTPLQLQIQEYADKTLSFGCIVNVSNDYYPKSSQMIFWWLDKSKDKIRLYKGDGTFDLYGYDFSVLFTVDYLWLEEPMEELVIWHPMNWGRLCYLWVMDWFSEKEESYAVIDYFTEHKECYQQTVLERPVELQEVVLKFLVTLQKND